MLDTNVVETAGPEAAAGGVEMLGISKVFGGIRALDDVTFAVRPGEVHALVGENGAGKSTLMRVLAGAHQATTGEIRIAGEPVAILNPHDSRAFGIGIIYQELALAPELTVAENIFLGELPRLVRARDLQRRASELLDQLGFDVDPAAKVANLPLASQQAVEIAKAMSRDVRILILDEPTAVLAPPEAMRLLEVVKGLSRSGVSVVYISHRLDEIFRIADQITVLKDGRTVGTYPTSGMTEARLVSLMVGRETSQLFPKLERSRGEELLRVENIFAASRVKDVSFTLQAGEVLGIAGLVGSGPHRTRTRNLRSRRLRARASLRRRQAGDDPLAATSSGGRHWTGARGSQGPRPRARDAHPPEHDADGPLTLHQRVRRATARGRACGLRRGGAPHHGARRQPRPAGQLASGGNQQKVVLSKWLDAGCRVIILDEPTRGVDVGARAEIYLLIETFAAAGFGVIVISSDLVEVIGAADRILVMSGGRISGELSREAFSEENIMQLALRSVDHVGRA